MNLNIGIDIGGASARMVVKGRGVVLDQSSACAFKNGAAVSVADEAYGLLGREYGSLEVAFPITAGIIAREDALEKWFNFIIGKAAETGLARISRILIAKPVMMSLSQARRYAAIAMRAGATACALMSCDLLAALGEGVDVKKPRGALVVDIGASQMSASVIARAQVVSHEHLNIGIESADGIIERMVRDKYSLSIGPATARAVRRALAVASDDQIPTIENCAGFDLVRGFPGIAKVETGDVIKCISPIIEQAKRLVVSVIDKCDARIQADILEDGAIVAGGGAALCGMREALKDATGIEFNVSANPTLSVANGLTAVLQSPDDYDNFMEGQQTLFDKQTPGR